MKKNISNKKIRGAFFVMTLMLMVLVPIKGQTGDLDSPAAPTDPASAMYTTDDIYNRLNSGVAGSKRTGVFTEPAAGPADGVGKSLDEIMSLAPIPDNTSGASPADVAVDKTYWGLRTDGTWGPQTGTATGGGGSSYPAAVPKTGQTTSDATGDDGDLQPGVAWPNPRFTDNSDGTVTDNLTGLIWLKNANCFGAQIWTTALNSANTLNFGECDLTDGSAEGDWRLPSRNELNSLVGAKYYNPSLSNTAGIGQWTEGNAFSGVQSNVYWSSTTYAISTDHAWRVHLYSGSDEYGSKAFNSYSYVWPVRD